MAKKYTQGLYDSSFERDSCGFGLIANIDNKPNHQIIDTAIESLKRLTHRGAISVDGKSGDGCGVLLKLPKSFFLAYQTESHPLFIPNLKPTGLTF